jgi:hypothetical protein
MRRLALLSAVLGVAALVAAAVFGLLGVEIDVAGQTYDCGAPIARLGGNDRENKWAEDSFLLNTDNANIPPDDLPQVACKQETDDRLTFVYVFGAVGVVLLVAAVVLFVLGRLRTRSAPTAPPPATPPPAAPPPQQPAT